MDKNTKTVPAEEAKNVTPQESTAVAIMEDENGLEMELESRAASFCSWKPETPAERAALFNAINTPSKRFKSCVNLVIPVRHLFMERVTLTNRETGEMNDALRTVVIDENGESYAAVSSGLYNAFKKLIQVCGAPPWNPAIKIMPEVIDKGTERQVTTFKVVADK